MKPVISIIVPSIRPKYWNIIYPAFQKAAKENSFEIIVPSPYLLPSKILKKSNVIFIHSYANPTICFMQAAALARGEFIYNVTDDGIIEPNVLDYAVKGFRDGLTDKDIVNMPYIEGVLSVNDLSLIKEPEPFHPSYWAPYTYPQYRKKAINPKWRMAPHFFMKREYFNKLGGFDCQYEYSNYSLHDLVFRAQYDGGKVYDLPIPAFLCSHLENTTGDHGAIHDCQTGPDTEKFDKLYSRDDAISSRVFLDLNDWKNYPSVWERRFNAKKLKLKP